MTIAIDADCALTYWMSEHAESTQRKRRSSAALLERIESGSLPDWAFAPDGTLYVVVSDVKERINRQRVDCRQGTTLFQKGAFVFAESGIPIVSPECCFLRLASVLSFPELVKSGMLLLSSFAISDSDVIVGRPPLISLHEIDRLLGLAASSKGIKQARRARRFLAGNAASPPEIDVTILLCLSPLLGGFGCPLPELNGHIKLDEAAARSLGYADCYCDLLWRKEKCAVEYTSEQFHTGYRKQAEDEIRRAALESMGYRVFLLTKPQLYGKVAFEGFARSVVRTLGKRMPKRTPEFQARQHELRRHLLYEPSWIISKSCNQHSMHE